jgi:uncharacterized protein (DUF779 family)
MQHGKLSIPLFLCAVFAFLSWQSAGATTMKILGIPDLTKASTHIVQGKIKSIKSSWNQEKTIISTDIELDVIETVKGSIGEKTIVLHMLGGKMDGRTTLVVGAPSFEVGEEDVLFLELMDKQNIVERDHYRLVGLAQGKFSVHFDKIKKTKVAVSEAKRYGLPVLPDEQPGNERIEGKKELTLDEFFQKIRNVESK